MTDWLPPSDDGLSPYTGWTRAHWEAVFARLTYGYVLASEKSGSPARALYPDDRRNLPDSVDALESFARMASAWGAWLRNPANPATVTFAGRELNIEMLLRQALLDGTNPDQPHTYWGDIQPLGHNLFAAAVMAGTIWLSAERGFNRLTEAERAQVMAWLAQVDDKGTYYDNWILFSAMAQMVRLKLGQPVSEADLDFRLAEISSFYKGDGWYVDGDGQEYELYNAWMFGWHFFLWAWIDGDRRPELRDLVLERGRAFIHGFQHFFGANGAYPAWGRSIVYRFAALAAFEVGHWLKIAPDDPGMLRRLTSGCIRYFCDHEMFDPETHYLRQGFHGDFPPAGEAYISPGSPYWACHGLFALTFDRDDPFWTAVEKPLPAEQGDFDVALPAPGLAVSSRSGQVFLLNSRSAQESDAPRHNYTSKYGKLVYSTHFPFNVLPVNGSYAPDGVVSLIGDDGIYAHRLASRSGQVAPGLMWSDYNLYVHSELQKLRVAVCLVGDLQIRLTFLLPCLPVRMVEAPGALGAEQATHIIRRSDSTAGWEYAEAERRALAIKRLCGYDSQRASAPFLGYSNINVAYPYVEQPLVTERGPSVAAGAFASASLLRLAPFDPAQEFAGLSVTATPYGAFTVTLPDGGVLYAALGFETPASAMVNGQTVEGQDLRVVRVKPEAMEVCGLNLTRVANVVELAAPGTLHLKRLSTTTAHLTTDMGFTLCEEWLGGPVRKVEAETLASGWVDLTAQSQGGGLSTKAVQGWAHQTQRTLNTFRVSA